MPPALLVSLALTLGGTLIGVGVAWGVLRTRLDALAEEVKPLRALSERVARLEALSSSTCTDSE
jgi:hypothetical protein